MNGQVRGMGQSVQVLVGALVRVPAVWIVLLLLPALAPLARAGFFESHDGLHHVYRLAALDGAIRAGVLYPRWFPELAFGYGHPVLNFYGPLSYYCGVPLTLLGLDAAAALQVVFAAGLVASALAMYRFARLHLGPGASLVAAMVYAYLPYHMLDLYVRGAIAEYLAFVWFPLILWAWHRLLEEPVKDLRSGIARAASAALSLVALLVTHSLSVLIFGPVLMGYVALLWFRRACWPAIARAALAMLLALALGAFYWLPVLTESGNVGLAAGTSQGYADHLLSVAELVSWNPAYPYTMARSAGPIFPLGLGQVALLAVSLVLPFVLRERRVMVSFWLAVALGSAAMLSSTSLPVWRTFERGLAFLQYPWRFQALTCLATAFLAGALVRAFGGASQRRKAALAALILLSTGLSALWRLPVVNSQPGLTVEAMWQAERAYGQVGTTWTGEFLPIWVKEQRWALSRPAEEPEPARPPLAAGEFVLSAIGHNRYDFALSASEGTTLVLHQFYYPGWEAMEGPSGRRYQAEPVGVLGLAGFELPAIRGPLTARLGYTPAQWWGTLVTCIAALGLGAILVFYQLFSHEHLQTEPRTENQKLAAAAVLLAAILLVSLALPNGAVRPVRQLGANLEDTAELLAFTTGKSHHQPGDTITVTLYWRALKGVGVDLKSFVHLTPAESMGLAAQHDGDPGGGYTPTSRWLPGEVVPDRHHLALPDDLPPGRYRLWAGLYEFETVRNLVIVSSEGLLADGRVLLGEIEVVAP